VPDAAAGPCFYPPPRRWDKVGQTGRNGADAAGPVPAWAQAHAAKARKGSLKALVALKCADCCCWRREEIRLCPVTACPLHPILPYRGSPDAPAAAP
jgi:hypothetical protein